MRQQLIPTRTGITRPARTQVSFDFLDAGQHGPQEVVLNHIGQLAQLQDFDRGSPSSRESPGRPGGPGSPALLTRHGLLPLRQPRLVQPALQFLPSCLIEFGPQWIPG